VGEKPTAKARRKAQSSHRYWPTATCIFWIGYGNGGASKAAQSAPGALCGFDSVVLCRKDVEEPLTVVRQVLERLGLRRNEAKTQVVDATAASFDFLGFSIRMSRGLRTGKPYPPVRPSDKSLRNIKTKLTARTGRELTPLALAKIVGTVHRSLSGWANYFHYRNSNQIMEKVKTHAEQRVRKHLMKRHKVKDRGIGEGRFPSVELYRRYGLYKVPTAAGWRPAHASA
jgi:RNA-directed DNA polymerase